MRAPTKTQAATAIETSTKTLLRTPDLLSPAQAPRAQRELVLRHGGDRAANECVREKQLQRREERHCRREWHQHAQRKIHHPDVPAWPDIPSLDITVIHPENQY